MAEGLKTNEGTPIESTPAGKFAGNPAARKEKREREAEKLKKAGGRRIDDPGVGDSSANCHGTVFDRGKSEIGSEAEVRKILRDNYLRLNAKADDAEDRQKVKVCDILIYGDPTFPRHSVLVIEVSEDGKPVTVAGKDSSMGDLWAHPPDAFGSDWQAFERRRNGLTADEAKEIAGLGKEYDDAAESYKKDKTDANRAKMHKAGYRLCQAKNALKHGK